MHIYHENINLNFPLVRSIKDRYQYYIITFKYTYIFKFCYHDNEVCCLPYIGAEFRILFICNFFNLPCIIAQRQTTAPFDRTHFLSSSDRLMPRLYQGSADLSEVDRNLDVIPLLHPYLTINYCNQSVLSIFPDLNIFI